MGSDAQTRSKCIPSAISPADEEAAPMPATHPDIPSRAPLQLPADPKSQAADIGMKTAACQPAPALAPAPESQAADISMKMAACQPAPASAPAPIWQSTRDVRPPVMADNAVAAQVAKGFVFLINFFTSILNHHPDTILNVGK
jgi:hypothetical protein